jgi:nicotinate-nucleotide--dimethylbenzimidazole phosphoribosyltransferase
MTAQSNDLAGQIRARIDSLTKPLGALGRIEDLAAQIAALQGRTDPVMASCALIIFAGDHGIAAEGVSAFPPEVTRQMVLNFLAGGAAANVFAASLGVPLSVVDAGMAGPRMEHPGLIDRRIARGTRNSAVEPAMTAEQCAAALRAGHALAQATECDALCLGEMGIANTSAASLVAHKVTGVSLDHLVGRGTGLDDGALARKAEVLARAAARTAPRLDALTALAEYGGFEIAMMAGAMLGAAQARRIVIVDGFIAGAAAAAALAIDPAIRPALVFAHRSAERGHIALLGALKAEPLLDLGLRLGEGTGALLAWPLVRAAAAMIRDMASFSAAGVSGPQ